MKKYLFFLFSSLLFSGIAYSQTVNVPDANFRAVLSTHYNITFDESNNITNPDTAEALTGLNVSDDNIYDLTGIEAFTSLTELRCEANRLSSLDLSSNTGISWLICNDNQLTSLDLSSNTKISRLICNDNQLTSLDLSSSTELDALNCASNQLTSLDLPSRLYRNEFVSLICNDNQLTSLGLSLYGALQYLDCDGNQLTSLDLSSNTALTYLDISGNPTPFTLTVWTLPFIIDDFFDTNPASTKILDPNGINDKLSMPKSFSLSQNYPNPFNPSTTIKFNLPKSSDVRIEVYNATGQKVQTLLNKKMSAGNHQIEFNAGDLASGVYLYKIEAGDFQDVKKMILIK